MTRERLRETYSPEKLAELYAKPHDHTKWPEHQTRVAVTVQLAHALVGKVQTAADLSCGNAEIPMVELFVCSETIEHLDQPELVGRRRPERRALLGMGPGCR